MADYSALAHDIYCIDAEYQQLGVAAIFLVVDGDEAALIETGTYHSMPNVLATLAELDIDPSRVRYVIPTHVHLDHAGGASAMMKRFANATLLVHPRGARHLIDPARLIAGTIAVYGEEKYRRLYGNIEPIDESRVQIAADESRFELGRRELLFLDTPGHARHHFCIHDAISNGIFSGDTLGLSYRPMKSLARGLIPTTPPNQFDPPALRDSLGRLFELAPRRLFLTHYGEYLDPLPQRDSFLQWIDQYTGLCARIDPREADCEAELERALGEMLLAGLADADENLEPVLRMDIRLNAQGLAHWWRGQVND